MERDPSKSIIMIDVFNNNFVIDQQRDPTEAQMSLANMLFYETKMLLESPFRPHEVPNYIKQQLCIK